ncbi:hypothetical protein JCM10207_007109 [Rhodosporidiobolus poonsookiae]
MAPPTYAQLTPAQKVLLDDDLPAPTTAELDEQPQTEMAKLGGFDLWKSMGEPKYVVAPMVDQSELAWRVLSRLHGANLCYTPMFHAALFASQQKYQPEMFDLSPGSIEGVAPYDRPLIVQFCANDKDQWLEAARKVEGRCDAVDLNLGCPQGIAKRGHYGAFLMEEWQLIRDMISHLHQHLAVPVIAKIRVFPSLSKTLRYAAHVFSSGAQIVAVHGRTREAKGQMAGFASWSKIKAVVDLVSPRVPVLANGGVPSAEEVEPCLEETGAYGILSAEGNLYNPMIFRPSNAAQADAYLASLPDEMRVAITACDAELDASLPWDRSAAAYAPATYIASQYLAIVLTLPGGTKTALSAVKAHLYKLFRPVWAAGRYGEMRESLGRCGSGGALEYREKVEQYVKWVDEFRKLLKADLSAGLLPASSNRPLTHAEVLALYGGVVPYSHCQPYLRVTKPAGADEEKPLKSVDGEAKRKREVEEGTVTDPDADPSKRLKPSPPSPSSAAVPTAIDPTAPLPSAVPTSVACTSYSGASAACSNAGAAKCAHGACKSCCAARRRGSEGKDGEGCEFHEEKERKAKEWEREKKAQKKARKAKGEERMKENERKVQEQKRAKREAAAQGTDGAVVEGGVAVEKA